MTNLTMRLDLSTVAATDLITMLVNALAQTTPGQRGGRVNLDLELTEDSTRKGQRNGHSLAVHADTQSAGVYVTAYVTDTTTCRDCAAPITFDSGLQRWVDARNGDDGGTFDWCQSQADRVGEGYEAAGHRK